MRRALLIIALSIPGISAALAQGRTTPGEGCLADIRDSYRDDFLTYGGSFRLWGTRLKDRFTSLSKEEEVLIRVRVKFESGLRCYESATSSKALSLDLSPTEFKGVFNGIVRDKAISLKPLPI